jgi:phosphatidate cytidylyltransferase
MSSEFIKRILSSIILLPSIYFIIVEGSFIFIAFIIICFFISIFEWNNISKKNKYNKIGFIFLCISFFCIYNLRINFNENYIFFLFVLIVCISTDIGGYVFGKSFKGPKLTKYSPNKTYSGVIGGFTLSIISMLVFNKIYNEPNFSLKLVIFTVMISLISQLGDIIISYFKRKSNIKDTGKIIPGHGGLLDRIDGMIFAFPFAYIIILTNLF